jgi:hypothetical protein
VSAGTELNAALEAESVAYRQLLAAEDAKADLIRARDAYLASHAQTSATSWGRILGALKMAILADDGAEQIARQAVEETAAAHTPASAYVRALAEVTLDRTPDVSEMLAEGGAFERTGRALQALAASDASGYAAVLGEILADFEARDQHLSGVAFADTAAVLERLAHRRGLAVRPASDILRA